VCFKRVINYGKRHILGADEIHPTDEERAQVLIAMYQDYSQSDIISTKRRNGDISCVFSIQLLVRPRPIFNYCLIVHNIERVGGIIIILHVQMRQAHVEMTSHRNLIFAIVVYAIRCNSFIIDSFQV